MTLQPEPLASVRAELEPLLVKHYDELTLHKDVVKLDVRWDDYFTLERLGHFLVITARNDAGELIGYNAFFVNRHMHYSGLTLAVNDVFYVRDDSRHGPAALRLIRYAERVLKDMGVQKIAYHFKLGNNLARILTRLGYSQEEGVAGKII